MMKTSFRIFQLTAASLLLTLASFADNPTQTMIKLDKPDTSRGKPVMQALAERRSPHEWTDQMISMKDMADLLWAANGINRPDSGRRTAPSALNAQDVEIYVFTTENVFYYDAKAQAIVQVASGDHRAEACISHDPTKGPSLAPVELILVSDGNKFPFGTQDQRREWGLLDTGIVAENIAIFCSGTGLSTRPRASIDKEKIAKIVDLKEGARAILDMPIGYAKD